MEVRRDRQKRALEKQWWLEKLGLDRCVLARRCDQEAVTRRQVVAGEVWECENLDVASSCCSHHGCPHHKEHHQTEENGQNELGTDLSRLWD